MSHMIIDGLDVSTFHATLLSYDIQPATVITFTDWMRQAIDPLFYGTKQTYKIIKVSLWIRDADKAACETDISNLCAALTGQHTIRFDDQPFYFFCQMSDTPAKTYKTDRKYQLDVSLQSAWAYLPVVTIPLTSQSQSVTAKGNLPSPAVVTLTASQDVGSVKLSGLTKKPITVSTLHAGAPVVIDGEACTVTEPDLETTLTEAQGADKWIFRKFSMASIANPDDTDIHMLPTKDTVPGAQSYTQQLIADGADLVHNIGYDYLGYLKTAVQVTSAKTVTLQFCHDDGCSVYLNGSQVYAHNYHMITTDSTGAATLTLNLVAGWNTIEIIWIQHYGGDGIYGITPTLTSQVDALNCQHATPDSPTGQVNKFPDTDMWAFPVLQPGAQTVSIDSAVCAVSIKYHPKFM